MNYTNPILKGFNPDPSMCRVGEGYYLVTSSFEYFPGIPVYHSTNLVNWTHIGNCINSVVDLPFDTAKASGGIWAPTIRYHEGRFYVTATFDGYGNFIIMADAPAGEWSKPVKVNMGGIDPSLFFENGRAYYCTNERGADRKEAISLAEINVQTGELLSEIRQIWNGIGGGFLEAPHIYHVGEFYYLLVAEGGTGLNHMIAVARSRDIWGLYESFEGNPILTNRNDTTKQIACSGHGDLVEDTNGNWWMVHLATRPVNNWLSHLGRESFLMPVIWENEWPVVGTDKKSHLKCKGPLRSEQKPVNSWQADFSRIEPQWLRLRAPTMENYILKDKHLVLKPSNHKLSGKNGSPTFMAIRYPDIECEVRVKMKFTPCMDGDETGMVLYLSDEFYYNICKKQEEGKVYIIVERHAADFLQIVFKEEVGKTSEVANVAALNVENATFSSAESSETWIGFKIEATRDKYNFYYAPDDGRYIFAGSAATRFLSCELAGKCFTGTLVGMYAQCEGETDAQAEVQEFGWTV